MSLGGSKELLFHSRSKTDDGRYLSTMQVSPKPLVYKGISFATMEHAYHWEKFDPKYASHPIPSRLLEFRKRLQIEGDIVDPKEAKKYGGKTTFKKLNVTLDTARFNPERVAIMTEIALARNRVDSKFAEILLKAKTDGVILKHHERGKKDLVFWGGTQNNLGKIYMKIGDMMSKEDAEGGEETKGGEETEGVEEVEETKGGEESENDEYDDLYDDDSEDDVIVDVESVEEDDDIGEEKGEPEEIEEQDSEEQDSEEQDVESDGENESENESESESDSEEEEEEDGESEDDEYLQKFDKDVRRNFLTEFHPESSAHNDVEVRRFASVVRNKDGDIIDDLHRTIPFLTKYEYTRIIGQRAKQIDSGALPFVEVRNDIIDGDIIAKMELEAKKIPFIIRRPMPGGGCEYWKLEDLEILH